MQYVHEFEFSNKTYDHVYGAIIRQISMCILVYGVLPDCVVYAKYPR